MIELNVGAGYKWQIGEELNPGKFNITIMPGKKKDKASVKEIQALAVKNNAQDVLKWLYERKDKEKPEQAKPIKPVKSFTDKQILALLKKGTGSSLPILQNVLIAPNHAMVTDLEIVVRLNRKFDVTKTHIVSLKTLEAILATGEFTQIHEDDGKLKCGNMLLPEEGTAEDYPVINEPKEKIGIVQSITQNELKPLTCVPVKEDDANADKFLLNYICVQRKNGKRKMISTDGKRLHLLSEKDEQGELKTLIPLSIAKIIQQNLRQTQLSVYKYSKKSEYFEQIIKASTGDIDVFCPVPDPGNFPKYEKVIPKATNQYIELNVEDTENMLKQIKRIADKEPKVEFDFKQKKVLHRGSYGKDGEKQVVYEEPLPKHYADFERIAFDVEFLLDIVQILNTDKIRLQLYSEKEAAKVEHDNFIAILMPMER